MCADSQAKRSVNEAREGEHFDLLPVPTTVYLEQSVCTRNESVCLCVYVCICICVYVYISVCVYRMLMCSGQL